VYDYSDRDDKSTKNVVLDYFGKVFTIVFFFEFFAKVIAKGFILGPNAYLKNAWNFIDFVVVISG
jgi:hypothetical protein